MAKTRPHRDLPALEPFRVLSDTSGEDIEGTYGDVLSDTSPSSAWLWAVYEHLRVSMSVTQLGLICQSPSSLQA